MKERILTMYHSSHKTTVVNIVNKKCFLSTKSAN